MTTTTPTPNFYRGDPRYPAESPHYVLHTGGWRSEQYRTRTEAQNWIDQYGVTQNYKEQHYSIVSVAEYWDRRAGNRQLRWA